MVRHKKEQAFTLAETLITLGIIGVVAALVIPPLVTEYQKNVTVEGYKKAYSTLQNAVKLSTVDNGAVESWDFPSTALNTTQAITFFNKYLKPYLSISSSCETATKGCWSKTQAINGNDSVLTGLTHSYIIKYILTDGADLSILNYGQGSNKGVQEIFVDINGFKPPNIMGKDVFGFILAQKSGSYNAGDGNLIANISSGGIYPDGYNIESQGDYATSYSFRGCGKDVTKHDYAGVWCGYKIIQDGYQIKDDYPW